MSIKNIVKSLLLLTLLFLLVFSHFWLKNNYLQQQLNRQISKVESFQNTLKTSLGQYDYLPYVLSQNQQLFKLAFTQPQQANLLLENIKKSSLIDAIYIMNKEGKTISASNWQHKSSFIGKNYAYRPYFKQALNNQKGEFFGVGATTSIPGFFVSAPYIKDGIIEAVIVVKVLLTGIEDNWNDKSIKDELVFATDENGVIILSSKQEWLYHSLGVLSPKQIKAIKEQKQFGSNPQTLLTINILKDTPNIVSIENKRYTQSTINADIKDWKIHYFVSYNRINNQLITFWSRILIFLLLALAAFLMVRSVNNRIALRQSQGESTSLRQLNKTLHHEIEERKQIENKLRKAQVELRRTSKLAAMGQLSASITHELGQPLSAMRTYIASMKVSHTDQTTANSDSIETLSKLDKLVDRMTTTSQQLRYFARSGEKETRPLDLRESINGAINTIQPSLQEADITLTVNIESDDPIMVKAGSIRLEQVIVNLIKNALDALQEQTPNQPDNRNPKIELTLSHADNRAMLLVEDNGPGIPEDIQKQLFEPFFTTKASGVGMGLGLAISTNIISELEGSLTVENSPVGGARFIINLPLLISHE